MEVHTQPGKGFKEIIYKDALEYEMRLIIYLTEEKNVSIYFIKSDCYLMPMLQILLFMMLLS